MKEHVAAELCREVLSERATTTRIPKRSSTVPAPVIVYRAKSRYVGGDQVFAGQLRQLAGTR